MHNNFLIQIVRSLSEEGRVFFLRRTNSCFEFNRLVLFVLVRISRKIGHNFRSVRKNFAKFSGEHLCQSLFLTKLQASGCYVFVLKHPSLKQCNLHTEATDWFLHIVKSHRILNKL